jgi:probable H4MPT-linked C1 transfer pathway protein
MSWLGIDIGGANIKLADLNGNAHSRPFPLWRHPERLAAELADLIERSALPASQIAVTMTGELADCFQTKRDGVCAIVDAAVEAANQRPIFFYATSGELLRAAAAKANHQLVAAANWHALAKYVGAEILRNDSLNCGMLIDIGSTTADLIPLQHGKPVPQAFTDTTRLCAGELVYAGVVRTPVCSLIEEVLLQGCSYPIARELFATTLDVYLMMEILCETDDHEITADGRAATREAAHDRLARMICADRNSFSVEDAISLSSQVYQKQLGILEKSARQVAASMRGQPAIVVVSGQGEFLAREIATRLFPQADLISLRELVGERISTCAPAYAVARLASESARQGILVSGSKA